MVSEKKYPRVLALLLAFLLLPLSAGAAGNVIVNASGKTAAGKAASLVTMNFASGHFFPKLYIAGSAVTRDTEVSNFINTAKAQGEPAVMVNGAYFNSYYNAQKTLSFPGNCASTQGMLVVGGRAVSSGGNVTLACTKDGRWLIDGVKTEHKFTVDGEFIHTAWGVNTYEEDGIVIYTPEVGMEVPLPAGAAGYIVRGGKVTGTVSGAFIPAAGETVIVIGRSAQANMNTWNTGPQIGSQVELFNVHTPSRPDRAGDWTDIDIAVSAGPLLLRSGMNVSGDAALNNLFQSDAKHQGTAQRTFIGVKADGSLVVGAASCTYSDAAETLKAMGCVDAMALDGGASSFLYADGATIRSAGRKLNNVLAFFVSAEPSPSPAPGVVANPSPSTVRVAGNPAGFDAPLSLEAYNIGGNNYFKLRDVALLLSGSDKQFEVWYDSASKLVTLITGLAYTPVGGELGKAPGTASSALPGVSSLRIDARDVSLSAYNIKGNNYFKLRDLAAALDFGVGYDEKTRAITLDMTTGYVPPG